MRASRNINGKFNGFGGVNWTSADKDGKLNVVSECFIGNTQVTGPGTTGSTRVDFVTDVTVKVTKKWTCVLENTFGHDTETPLSAGGFGPASWTGWTNYLFYTINDCWSFGTATSILKTSTAPWSARTLPGRRS